VPEQLVLPKLKELHLHRPPSSERAEIIQRYQKRFPGVSVHFFDPRADPDPFIAHVQRRPLDPEAAEKLASLFPLERLQEPDPVTEFKPTVDLQKLACTALFRSEPARVAQLERIKIALLDSGVHPHFDLEGTYEEPRVFVSSEISWLDLTGHGTHCAGILVGKKGGVACGARLYVAKVADRHSYVNAEDVAKGVKWAIKKDVDIISLSLGGFKYHHGLYTAIQKAIKKGIIVVCAAGNAGSVNQFNVRFPATIPGVIRVGSVNSSGRASPFTSVGGAHIDAAGPGEDILSTWIKRKTEDLAFFSVRSGTVRSKYQGYANSYIFSSGTSTATPFIAGIIAWLLAYDRSRETIRPRRLMNSHCVKDLLARLCFNPSGDIGAGRGMLNLQNILELPEQFDYLLSRIC
jgi:subtilisin